MKIKFAGALAALAFAGTALAGPYPDSITTPLTFSANADDPGTLYAQILTRNLSASQSVNDYFTFHVSAVSDVSFSVTADALYNAKGTVLLQGAQFDLLKVNGPNDFLGSGTIKADGLSASFGFEKLAVGDYTVTLFGHAVGKAGGNYYGNASLTAAVPEPEAIAMALAGLAVVGGLARRRKTV